MTGDLRLVIFDWDGTLMDSQELIVAAMTRAFAVLGRPVPTRAQMLDVVGLSVDDGLRRMVPGIPDAEAGAGAQAYRDAYVALRGEMGGEAAAPLYPGARAAIEALHAVDEVLLGVATGKARRGLDHALAGHDMGSYFVTLQTPDRHPSKPHPAMVHAALAETGVAASRAVMVGDTSFDIEMGRAAGVATIGVSWGYHGHAALAAAGADLIIDDFAALPGAVHELTGEGA